MRLRKGPALYTVGAVQAVTSHFAPTSTRPTNSPQVGRRPLDFQLCHTETFAVLNCCIIIIIIIIM